MNHYRTFPNKKIEFIEDSKIDWETIGVGVLMPVIFYMWIILISLL